jgi:prepilin-type N-terminal cleavage/methylation domain-containing protein
MTRPRPESPSAKKRARGYTAVEVLVSLSIVLIGAAGVISMQRATIQGNVDARRMDMATAIARQWVERLRADSMLWTLPAARNANSNFDNALLLQNVDGLWHVPDERLASSGWSPGLDSLGADVAAGDLADDLNRYALFCTNVRRTWLIQNQMMRVDVRVFWPRGVSAAPDKQFCTQGDYSGMEAKTDAYHFVYAMTAIRRNAMQ